MGTWITFNVGEDRELRDQRTQVLKAFIERGGGMIDCSPMYGSSADVLGYGIERLKNTDRIFSADKIWTRETAEGPDQIQEQQKRWGFETFDLMQVHNLINWRAHLETLRAAKERGQIRYIGITTSHGLRHAQFKQIMETEDLDFVQFSYNILNRDAERDLLPLARERGIAVIANRPFQRKELIRRFQDQPLPDFAAEIGVRNWPQFLLKFIISHPAVTCAIPATTRVDHMIENMGALKGALPDNDMRNRMTRYVEDL